MEHTHPMTYAYLEPWIGNAIDLTLSDGSHCIGLLEKVDAEWATLNAGRGKTALPDGGKVLIAGAVSFARASRN